MGVDSLIQTKKDDLAELKKESYYQQKKTGVQLEEEEKEEEKKGKRKKKDKKKKKWVDLDTAEFSDQDGIVTGDEDNESTSASEGPDIVDDVDKAVKKKEKEAKKARKAKKKKTGKKEDLFDPENLEKYRLELEEKRKERESALLNAKQIGEDRTGSSSDQRDKGEQEQEEKAASEKSTPSKEEQIKFTLDLAPTNDSKDLLTGSVRGSAATTPAKTPQQTEDWDLFAVKNYLSLFKFRFLITLFENNFLN